MKRLRAMGIAMLLCITLFSQAQQTVATNTNVAVPPLIQFSNVATDVDGGTLSGVVSITFSLYAAQQGGEPLWTETQNNVPLDATGHYSVQLGITKPNGVPTTLFTTGEARWLGVQIAEHVEQPRVLLLSVPYALKAGDAQTLGGLPASAFVLAAPSSSAGSVYVESPAGQGVSSATSTDVTTSGGTVGYLPLWDSTSDILSSVLYQSGSGSTALIGINTTTPATTLDVKGTATLRGTATVIGTLSLPATGTAKSTGGKNSEPLSMVASAYNSSTDTAVNQKFQWQAEAIDNDTSTASGTLNLLYGQGTSTVAETGLHIASNGQISFATGQTFPGTGDGTITGVTAGTGLTGGGSSGNVTLNNTGVLGVTAGTGISVSSGQTPTIGINTSVVPQLNTANTFTGNQTVNGNLTATGVVSGSGFQIGSNLFAFGSWTDANAFLGFSGNTTMTGTYNTAAGELALTANTTGASNTAAGGLALAGNTSGNSNTGVGVSALQSNSTGSLDTASGADALGFNTTGSNNTATGAGALGANTAGDNNTADGLYTLFANTTGGDNTATGYYALSANTSGSQSTADGYGALENSTSCCNVGVGNLALQSVTTGIANTGVGNVAGKTANSTNITGKNNTFLGTGTTIGDGSLTNATALGANAEVDASNTLVLGSVNGVNGQTVTVNVGIGTTTPDANLSVNGTADKTGGGSWGTYSDRRLKNLDGSFGSGLSQIMKINPVRYRYKEENAMGITDHEEHVGLVAQEVQKVIPEAVTENNKGYLLVNNDPIIWTMLNAIKEQQHEIAVLRRQLHQRDAKEARLESRLTQLEHDRTEGARLASSRPASELVLK